MSEEEKKATEELEDFIEDDEIQNISVFTAKKIKNIIVKQQIEIEKLLKEYKMKIIENLINKYFTKTLMNNLAYEIQADRIHKTSIRYNGKYATLNVCNFRKYNSKFVEIYRCSFNHGLSHYCHDYFEILKEIRKDIEVLENENKL